MPKTCELIAVNRPISLIGAPTDIGAGKKSEANWKKYTKMMMDAAVETYDMSKQPKVDLKKLQTSIGKINISCTECHNVFKTGG